MRILLVMPTPFERGRLGLENIVWLSEPVALTSVGTAAQADGHEVRVIDMRLEPEDALARELVSFRPDVVGTTSMTTDAYQAKAALRMARSIMPDALTVVGGHHPTLSPDEFDEPYVDVIVQGEGEETFRELLARWVAQRAADDRTFAGVPGTRYRDATGARRANSKRAQTTSLDALPAPDRKLIEKYAGRYFFMMCRPMASIFTSRGCSYDCNFCAIWEFYERRVRYLSARAIVDQMEACAEPFVFILDDNFLVNKKRIHDLCDEIEKRGVKKFWMTQGRTDFVADNPELMARLARCGLAGLLSGFESNDDDNLAALRKGNTWDKNVRANAIMRDLGIFSTGIFMVRPDWTAEQFQQLYDYINTLDIFLPLVTILTPLPGTQLYRAYKDKLLTHDHRLFDLLHAVLPTKLPRAEFYAQFARSLDACAPSVYRSWGVARKRWDLFARIVPNLAWYFARSWRYLRVHRDASSYLRDEEGLMNGPGTKAGLTWDQIAYPTGEEHTMPEAVIAAEAPATAAPEVSARTGAGGLVKLRIPRKLWADELPPAQNAPAAPGVQ